MSGGPCAPRILEADMSQNQQGQQALKVGRDPRMLPEYEALRAEINKLSHASRPEVDWLKIHIPRLMAEVAALKVPLLAEVGVGANWDKAH